MTKRIDIHRPGAIIPTAYALVLHYIIPGEDPFERWNTDLAVTRGREHVAAGGKLFGGLGRCGVCGANFRYGAIYRHESGDLVHMGRDCAEKYEILADDPEFCAQLEAIKRNRKARIEAKMRDDREAAFYAMHEGLKEALDTDHNISRDLKAKLRQYGNLSPKQIDLAFKLQRQANEPPKPEEAKVTAPIVDGRQTVRGVVVSTRVQDSDYGSTLKACVKMTTPDGIWLAWGSVPIKWDSEGHSIVWERGDEVEFTARFSKGRDPHFAFYSRPTKCTIIKAAKAS